MLTQFNTWVYNVFSIKRIARKEKQTDPAANLQLIIINVFEPHTLLSQKSPDFCPLFSCQALF